MLNVIDQQPPLKVIRAFETVDHGALVHLHNVSGGVLGGDHLSLAVEIEPHARAQLTTTSATRLYRNRNTDTEAVQLQNIQLAENSLLEMLPDPIIPFQGSVYRQQTRIELGENAGLFWWETVAPGREARGEIFEYASLTLKTEIWAGRFPIALEAAHLRPESKPLSALIRLGKYRYFSTFYICHTGIASSRWSSLESELRTSISVPEETILGVSTLVKRGLVVRILSNNGRSIPPIQAAIWNIARQALYGQKGVLPRKIY